MNMKILDAVIVENGFTFAKAGLVRTSVALIEPLFLTGNVTVVIAFDAAPT